MMHSVTLAAQAPEFDFGQVVFVIVLLLSGFFQWLMNWWKKKRADSEFMRQKPPTPEELQAREKAWLDQTGAGEQVPQQPAAGSFLEEVIKTFRQLAEPELVVAPTPAIQYPPIPQAVPVIDTPSLVPSPVKMPASTAAIVQHRPRHPLAEKLAAIGGLRHAIVLREIIGPPKALQRTDEHLI